MNTLHRFVAALTSTSLLLSAVPAFAADISLENNAEIEVSGDGMKMMKRGHFFQKLFMKNCEQLEDAQERDRCMLRMRGTVRAESSVDTSRPTPNGQNAEMKEKMHLRVGVGLQNALNRIIQGTAKMAKRACNAGDADTTVAACMEKAKADFSAKVSVMIDAAFGM